MYHFTDGGLKNVWLTNGFTIRDTSYGRGVSIQDMDGLVKVICHSLSTKPGKLTGAEFRYIRNYMQLSQKSLGQLLGYTEQAVAKWEKTGKIPKLVEYGIRHLFCEKHDGSKKVCSMLEAINLIDRIAHARIIVSEKRNRWVSKFEDTPSDELMVAA